METQLLGGGNKKNTHTHNSDHKQTNTQAENKHKQKGVSDEDTLGVAKTSERTSERLRHGPL